MKNKYKESRNKNVKILIEQFDKQIKIEYKQAKGKKEECQSYWNKLLFLQAIDLDFNDWRIIASEDYWKIRDSLNGIEQSKFIYNTVANYLKKKKKQT